VALLFLVARRLGLPGLTCVRTGSAVVVVGSLACSLWATSNEPAGAYFVTHTRVWELGPCGLLAALLTGRSGGEPDRRGPCGVLVVAGLPAVGWSALQQLDAVPGMARRSSGLGHCGFHCRRGPSQARVTALGAPSLSCAASGERVLLGVPVALAAHRARAPRERR
jgi:peptidoglycan/LPS O-acetylase OafA/YrhL